MRDATFRHRDDGIGLVTHRGRRPHAVRIVDERERGSAQGGDGTGHRRILSRELLERGPQLRQPRRFAQHAIDVGRNVLLVEQPLAPAGEQDDRRAG